MLPLYPETTGGAHPVCTDVQKLKAAKREGRKAVQVAVGVPLGLSLPVDSIDEEAAEEAAARSQQQQQQPERKLSGSWAAVWPQGLMGGSINESPRSDDKIDDGLAPSVKASRSEDKKEAGARSD